MPVDPQNEPGLDQSVKNPREAKHRSFAGKGLVLFFGGFVTLGFLLYLFIVVYGATTSN